MVQVESYEGRSIGVTLPQHVNLQISETEPHIKGQTVSSSYKPAILENGLKCMVPPFLSTGETIIVDTTDISYVRRAD